MRKSENPYKYRIRICFITFFFFFTCLFLRAFYLQVIPDAKLKRVKETQESGTFTLSAPRGTIYDRFGRALAVSIELPSVFIDPSIANELSKKDLENLGKILKIHPNVIVQKIKNKEKKFVWLKRKMSPDTADKIKNLSLRPVGVVNEWDRFYPDRESASQIIGIVNRDGEGTEGIEKYYDDFLYSTPTVMKMQKDAKGRIIDVGSELRQQGRQGVDVYLTIDSTIQYILEKELIGSAVKHNVKQAMGMVFNPKTGEILAASSFPQANPNKLEAGDDILSLRNLNVLDVFEPGSIFKIFVLAGALEKKVIGPAEIFDCRKGSLKIGSKEIVNPVQKEWLDPRGILKFSNNVGMSRISMKMGKDRVIDTLEKFGFGKRTGIDFPGEGPGMFQKEGKWHDMRLANISFGQGIAVTPIQLAEALSIVANGGYRVQPYFVDHVDLGLKQTLSFKKESGFDRPLFSKKTLSMVQSWMEAVTEEDGTGFRAKIPGYRTAGKTGTAQIYDPVTKEYSHDELVASFFGFAPVSDPQLAAMIIYRQPRSAQHGGEISAPVFRRVMEQVLHYMDVPKDEKPKKDNPLLQAQTAIDPAKYLSRQEVPDFLNMSIRQALEVSQANALPVEFVGTGTVYKQEPAKGKKISDKKIKLYCRVSAAEGSL
jgi:cell division protein FtsI (penicillin-binding protein 3)